MFIIPRADSPPPHDDFWFTDFPLKMPNGTFVAAESAVRYPAVYDCVRIIAETMMSLPLLLYRRTNDGKERAETHPLFKMFHGNVTENMTTCDWIDTTMWHVLLRGNAYSVKGSEIRPTELPILHPDRVRPERLRGTNRYRFIHTDEDGSETTYLQSEILHIRGPSDDGFLGLNPMELHHTTTLGALTQMEFTRRFYENDARPGGWIEHPSNFKSEEDRRAFRNSWQQSQTGKNWNKTAVLEFGMKYNALDMKLTDAQFLETKKYSNLDIARIFRVPPHKIGELERATHSNIEQQAIEFRQDTILPWARRIETRLTAALLTPGEISRGLFFEFLLDGLERGDSAARSKLYHFAVSDGWMTRNEVRKKENLAPLEGLDEPLTPMNMDRTTGLDDDEDDDPQENALLKRNAAEVCVRKEASFLRKAFREGKPDTDALATFYGEEFPSYLKTRLMMDDGQVDRYIRGSAEYGAEHVERWERLSLPRLLEIVL